MLPSHRPWWRGQFLTSLRKSLNSLPYKPRTSGLRLDIPRLIGIIQFWEFDVKLSKVCSFVGAIRVILIAHLFACTASYASQQLEYDEDWYHTCADKVAQETKDRDSLRTRLHACAYKAVPKVCRTAEGVQEPSPVKNSQDQTQPKLGWSALSHLVELEKEQAKREQDMRERTSCIKRCMSASFFSRAFGECRKG
jgi:hypothetical protein